MAADIARKRHITLRPEQAREVEAIAEAEDEGNFSRAVRRLLSEALDARGAPRMGRAAKLALDSMPTPE